ncbi:unnamed protein product [Phytophthora fragariaefolia]|uniref:Unnamed protein product n=1 Tax=Phytophthora fragariaefolia TaxID=1490495 RepID=A0A9W6TR71_9STRA|nr:unnamed protein product [Phytophthora fragariaefolia]
MEFTDPLSTERFHPSLDSRIVLESNTIRESSNNTSIPRNTQHLNFSMVYLSLSSLLVAYRDRTKGNTLLLPFLPPSCWTGPMFVNLECDFHTGNPAWVPGHEVLGPTFYPLHTRSIVLYVFGLSATNSSLKIKSLSPPRQPAIRSTLLLVPIFGFFPGRSSPVRTPRRYQLLECLHSSGAIYPGQTSIGHYQRHRHPALFVNSSGRLSTSSTPQF